MTPSPADLAMLRRRFAALVVRDFVGVDPGKESPCLETRCSLSPACLEREPHAQLKQSPQPESAMLGDSSGADMHDYLKEEIRVPREQPRNKRLRLSDKRQRRATVVGQEARPQGVKTSSTASQGRFSLRDLTACNANPPGS